MSRAACHSRCESTDQQSLVRPYRGRPRKCRRCRRPCRRSRRPRIFRPRALAGATWVSLPASSQRLEVKTSDGELLTGVRIPSVERKAEGAAALLGFGGNPMSADATALTLHWLFPHRDVVVLNYRGYATSTGRPSAQAVLLDSACNLRQPAASAGDREYQCGWLKPRLCYRGLFGPASTHCRGNLGHALLLAGALARDLYWLPPVRLLLRHRMPTIEFVSGSLAPTALINAERDKIVPARRSAPLLGR